MRQWSTPTLIELAPDEAARVRAEIGMNTGMDIATRHAAAVRELLAIEGTTPDQALNGCVVWLAGNIMRVLEKADAHK